MFFQWNSLQSTSQEQEGEQIRYAFRNISCTLLCIGCPLFPIPGTVPLILRYGGVDAAEPGLWHVDWF